MVKKAIKYVYLGDINNWMDFRDMLGNRILEADTELKLNLILTALSESMSEDVEEINTKRKKIGLKKLTKKEEEKLKTLKDLGEL